MQVEPIAAEDDAPIPAPLSFDWDKWSTAMTQQIAGRA
jgi:hypothetical protein